MQDYERSLAIKQGAKDNKDWAQKAANPLTLTPKLRRGSK